MKASLLKEYTDKQLVLEYQASGTTTCLEELYRRYHPKVYHYCCTILKDRDTASDLTQDTFVRMVSHLSRLRHSDTFTSWLFHIARNLCLDHIRKQSRRKAEKLEEVMELADEIIDVEELEAKEHRITLLETLINELNHEDRAMLPAKIPRQR